MLLASLPKRTGLLQLQLTQACPPLALAPPQAAVSQLREPLPKLIAIREGRLKKISGC